MTINFKDVSFSYYDNQLIFENFNALFEDTGIDAIFGLNGQGKTTLLNLINKNLRPSSGKIEGIPESRMIIYDSDIPFDFLTGYEFIKMTLEINNIVFKKSDIQKIASDLNLSKKDLFKNIIKFYSNGMKYKTLLVCVLYAKPDLLLLDEPFTELDIKSNISVVNLLKNSGIGKVIISTHTAEIAFNYANKIIYLSKHKIDSINTKEFSSANKLSKYIYNKMEDNF